MKYDRLLYMSDHPELEALYQQWMHSIRRYGNGTWSHLFKTNRYESEKVKREQLLAEIAQNLFDTIGHHVEFTVINSHEPYDVGGIGWRKIILYKKKADV